MLGLDAEQEAAGEGEDIVDAGRPVVLDLERRQVALVEVTVGEGDQPPDHGEAQPGEHEAQAEAEQRPAPLRVHQGREDVLEEAQRPPRDAGLEDVAVAILQNRATAQLARRACSVTAPETFPKHSDGGITSDRRVRSIYEAEFHCHFYPGMITPSTYLHQSLLLSSQFLSKLKRVGIV